MYVQTYVFWYLRTYIYNYVYRYLHTYVNKYVHTFELLMYMVFNNEFMCNTNQCIIYSSATVI